MKGELEQERERTSEMEWWRRIQQQRVEIEMEEVESEYRTRGGLGGRGIWTERVGRRIG